MRLKYFAINVESNTYRRDHVLSECARYDIPVEIFKAITPETIETVPHQYNSRLAKNFTGRDLKDTEIACGLSHIALWRQLMNDDEADFYVILEDDIQLQSNIDQILKNMNLTGIDFLKLSGKQERPKREISPLDDFYSLYQFAYGPLDCSAYLITKKGAKVLDDYCQSLFAPIDILMDRTYDHGIQAFGILPYPVTADFCFDVTSPLYTTIGIRNDDFKKDRTWHMFFMMRYHRLIGSLKRKWAAFQLCFGSRNRLHHYD